MAAAGAGSGAKGPSTALVAAAAAAVGAALGGLAVYAWKSRAAPAKSSASSVTGGGDKSKADLVAAIAPVKSAATEFFSETVVAILAERYRDVDPDLPELMALLVRVGANQCWHKHGSFAQHLFRTWRILRIWESPQPICRLGLYHSAYSNSYVNLAIFKESEDRDTVQRMIGADAERLVYVFCRVSRHKLIYDRLLLRMAETKDLVVPRDGLVMEHIKNGTRIHVTRRLIGWLCVTTMADFAEQLFEWQDLLFANGDGKLHYAGNQPDALWPGTVKPGLWMNMCSRAGMLARSCLAGADAPPPPIAAPDARDAPPNAVAASYDAPYDIVLPPVFDRCTAILSAENERDARDAYWQVVTAAEQKAKMPADEALALLQRAVDLNPYIAEPHNLLAQLYVQRKEWAAAERHALRALRVLGDWGDSWDKRVSWEGWIAWSRVLLNAARNREWPNTAFGILSLGLVE